MEIKKIKLKKIEEQIQKLQEKKDKIKNLCDVCGQREYKFICYKKVDGVNISIRKCSECFK